MSEKVKNKLTNLFMEEAGRMFDKMSGKKPILEQDDEDIKVPGEDSKSDKKSKMEIADKKESEEEDGKRKSETDKVDEIIKQIDLIKIKNKGRLELIEVVIDSAQNSEKEADDFQKFIDDVTELISGYAENFGEEPEDEDEDESEEDVDVEGEGSDDTEEELPKE